MKRIDGEAVPPSSNTGGKFPARSFNPVHVDAVAFSFIDEAFNEFDLPAFSCMLERFFTGFSATPRVGGAMGFGCSAEVNIGGLVAWGNGRTGGNQRGRVFVSLMGMASACCKDWRAFAQWIDDQPERLGFRIARVDLAYDDLDAKHYSVEQSVTDYGLGAFNAGGTPPSHQYITSGKFGERQAQTFYIGKSENGRMFRIYEKGQQLQDCVHPNWVRVEMQPTAKDRVIPTDTLRRPDIYLAGSCPALAFIAHEKQRIKTCRIVAEKTLEAMTKWAQRQTGKVVHALLKFHNGDVQQVLTRITVHELPRRLLFWDHLPTGA